MRIDSVAEANIHIWLASRADENCWMPLCDAAHEKHPGNIISVFLPAGPSCQRIQLAHSSSGLDAKSIFNMPEEWESNAVIYQDLQSREAQRIQLMLNH